jgi:hypothetical protein
MMTARRGLSGQEKVGSRAEQFPLRDQLDVCDSVKLLMYCLREMSRV